MKDPISMLRQQIDASTLRKTALALGISAPYLSDIMLGRRLPGPKVLKALGLTRTVEREVTYRVARR